MAITLQSRLICSASSTVLAMPVARPGDPTTFERHWARLRHQQDGAMASKGGPDFVSPEDQFRMSLDTVPLTPTQRCKSRLPWRHSSHQIR